MNSQTLSAETLTEAAQSAVTPREERITSLDILRGFALLGILLMNIVSFGLYWQAYNDPTVAGGATGPNLWIWAFLSVAAEGKMRAMFSLVFGASMILLTSRLETRSDGADIWYRRLLWLMLFGIAHAYLLWLGEILYLYALCGLVLYPFRKLNPVFLIRIAAACILITASWALVDGSMKQKKMEAGQAAIAKTERNESLTGEEAKAKEEWEGFIKERYPSAEELQKDAEKWRGGFLDVIQARAAVVVKFHSAPYYTAWHFDVWGMMILGMALFKLGVLSGERSTRFYLTLCAIGYAVGIPLGTYKAWLYMSSNFDPVVEIYTFALYDVQRLAVMLGHLGLLMLLIRSGFFRWLFHALGAVGQMAFTNYIMHSVICTLIFTGHGFGLYGALERYQLYYIVAGIWILQLVLSPIWLRHFRCGPLEWGWRRLSYWQPVPLKRAP